MEGEAAEIRRFKKAMKQTISKFTKTIRRMRAAIKARDIRLHGATPIANVIREEQRRIAEEWTTALKIRSFDSRSDVDAINREFLMRMVQNNIIISRCKDIYPGLSWPEFQDGDILLSEMMALAEAAGRVAGSKAAVQTKAKTQPVSASTQPEAKTAKGGAVQ